MTERLDPRTHVLRGGFHLVISDSSAVALVSYSTVEAAGPGHEEVDRYYDLEYSSDPMAGAWEGVTGYTNLAWRWQHGHLHQFPGPHASLLPGENVAAIRGRKETLSSKVTKRTKAGIRGFCLRSFHCLLLKPGLPSLSCRTRSRHQ